VCVEINSRHINIGQEKLDQPNSNLKTAVENGIESAEKAKSDASSDQTSSLAIYQTEAGNGRNLTDLDANTGSIHFSSQTDKNGGEPLPQKKTSAITNNEKSNVPKTDSTLGDENMPDELCSLLERQGFPLVSGCNKSGRLGIWN
ncbi:hypothetical protein MAR_020635, partial [Mya arenaria]